MTAVKHNAADLIWKSPGKEIECISLSFHQAISELYLIHAEIKSADDGLAFADMLHANAKIVIKCGDELADDRILSGIVTRFTQKRTRHGNIDKASGKNYLYDVEIRPAFWMLVRQHRSKVFQKKNAKQIVSEVLNEHGVQHQWKLQESPKYREYTVQYDESDYRFVSRLLEDEGICFYFDHKAGKVIFANHPGGHEDCTPKAEARYVEEISPRFQYGKHEFIRDFSYEETVGTGAFVLNHYNYETSLINIKAEETEDKVPCFPEVEVYEHSRNYKNKAEGSYYAKIWREEQVARVKVARGATTCRSFEAGYTMTMTDHFRGELNRKWLLTSCAINMEQGKYHCQFTALPADLPFRPVAKTPRPKVYGLQTAKVTGPDGAKVYLDKLGRCKLQYHWDREGGKDEKASMWVRVSNNYAGKDYGIQWIPRVGHEVLVTFIDGNPDLPIVTGRVYNDFNTPPLGPANKWQNIIKSIKDNHIMFDDKDGKELVDVRAERDMNTLVVHDDAQSVGNNRSISVGVNHDESIGKNMGIQVGKNLTERVGVNYEESVGSDYTISVGANMRTSVTSNKSLSVGKNADSSIGDNYTMVIGKKAGVQVGKDIGVSGGKKAMVDIADQLTLTVGNATVIIKKNGDIQIKGKKINVKASGPITMKGSKISQN